MKDIQKRTQEGDRLQVYPKGAYEVMKAGDPTTALLDIAIHSLNSGSMPKYSNDAEGLRLFQERTVAYFKHLKEVNENRATEQFLLPDIESWALYLGITRQTIWHYRKLRGQEWQDYILLVKTAILAQRKDAVSRFKMPPMAYIFDAVNNFDYVNTNQIVLQTDPQAEEVAELETELQDNGLVWDPEKEDYIAGAQNGS